MKASFLQQTTIASVFFILLFAYSSANSKTTNIIIVGGGKTQADAIQAKSKFKNSNKAQNITKEEIVLMLSDTIEGLNPGFHIAVLGCCDDDAIAKLLVKCINAAYPGVYAKKIPSFGKYKHEFSWIPFTCINVPTGWNKYTTHTKIYKTIKIRYDEFSLEEGLPIYVRNKVPATFSTMHGDLTIDYYFAWVEQSIVLLNQFQYFNKNIPINNLCTPVVVDEVIDDNSTCYQPTWQRTERCDGPLGIYVETHSAHESSDQTTYYPGDSFNFEDLLSAYIAAGLFHELFEDYAAAVPRVSCGDEIPSIRITEDIIELEYAHDYIIIKDNGSYIEVSEGAGA